MGRKTLPRSKVRQVVSISLPRDTIERLDSTLNGRTRSRVIENLINLSLRNKELITDFKEQYHIWKCNSCNNEWKTNRPPNRTLMCSKKSCRSHKIEYEGVWRDDDE